MSAQTLALPALSPGLAIALAVVLGVVGLAVVGAAAVFAVKKIKAARAAKTSAALLPGLPAKLDSLKGSPLLQEVAVVIQQAIHDSQHAALNAAVAKMFPGLTPFLPLIDKGADLGESVLAKQLGIGVPQVLQVPAAPAPSQPAPVLLQIPAGHPVLDLLRDTLEAKRQQNKAA